jgi:hypothetical protein
LQYGGFSAFLETKVLYQSSGFYINFGAENRHIAKPKTVIGHFKDRQQ